MAGAEQLCQLPGLQQLVEVRGAAQPGAALPLTVWCPSSWQMSAALLGRLQSGRVAGERTLGVLQVCELAGKVAGEAGPEARSPPHLWHHARAPPLPSQPLTAHPQAFAAADAAYARAMSSVAKLSLCGEADGPSLRAAMERASDLPLLMATSHSSVRVHTGEARSQLLTWHFAELALTDLARGVLWRQATLLLPTPSPQAEELPLEAPSPQLRHDLSHTPACLPA